uniref:Keratin, type I cytoskeletal 13 n=1 Tax=Lepisosteus oculatus TaxID=7918 RepID=W5MJH8_LEPOC
VFSACISCSSFSSLGFGSGSGAGTGSGFAFGAGGSAGYGYGAGGGLGGGAGAGAGAGGRFGYGFGAGAGAGAGAGGEAGGEGSIIFMGNEKQLMHGLNDRLAAYLEKVRSLEATNKELEEKLRNFTVSKVQTHDLSAYDAQLKPLREQILALIQENSHLALEIDNSKLAADDFRSKYETEYSLRQAVETDINGLKGLKKEYEITQSTLMQDVEALKEEMDFLRKNHGEELANLRDEMSGTVHVDLQAITGVDLSRVLEDIRSEYEAVVRRNQDDAERWFLKQAGITQEMDAQSTQMVKTDQTEFTELRRSSQSLSAELEALKVSKMSLEERLSMTNARYQSELQQYAVMVGGVEEELSSIRESITLQSQEYQSLLNLKMKLEMEIATYKQLLEGVESGTGGGASVTSKSSTTTLSSSNGSSSSNSTSSTTTTTTTTRVVKEETTQVDS